MRRLLICMVLFPVIAYGQTIRPQICALVDSIAEDDALDFPYVGYATTSYPPVRRLYQLKTIAYSQELLALTADSRPIIKCAAFVALCTKDSVDVIPIVIDHLSDTSIVAQRSGCSVSYRMTGDYFLEALSYYSLTKGSNYYTNNQSRLSYIDSLLFYAPNIRLAYKESKIKAINGDSLYYNRIREIAIKERMPVAVLALAKYRKQQDKQIIECYFAEEETQYYAIWAVREFPDTSFYPLLVQVFEKEWKRKYYNNAKWRILYQALAQYPGAQTVALFDKAIDARKKHRHEYAARYLAMAVSKYPDALFSKYQNVVPRDESYHRFLEHEADIEK